MYEREIPKREQRELIRRAKECDLSAFARLYEHYYQDIYNYIRYRVPDTPVAEDLASEVFLKALESIDSFTFRGLPLSVWLFRIARNLMVDYFRSRPSRPDLPLREELLPAEGGPSDVFERKLTQQQLTRGLSHLTGDQQEVIILKFVDGLSNTEVAQILGKSEGAIKSLQHRALNSLNRILEVDQTSEVSKKT
ncbi:MAG: sigma-70 family RNA polymerase sigma factor [Anaerolineae bacterium]